MRANAGWLTKLVIDLFVKTTRSIGKRRRSRIPRLIAPSTIFVRLLRDDVRPLNTDPNVLVMPADGVISQLGAIENDKTAG